MNCEIPEKTLAYNAKVNYPFIDEEIRTLVCKLNLFGYETMFSCSGHDTKSGYISFIATVETIEMLNTICQETLMLLSDNITLTLEYGKYGPNFTDARTITLRWKKFTINNKGFKKTIAIIYKAISDYLNENEELTMSTLQDKIRGEVLVNREKRLSVYNVPLTLIRFLD